MFHTSPAKFCKNRQCRYCPLLDKSGTITSTITHQKYTKRPQRVTCKFNNLVYLITCKICQKQYVGETKNALGTRFSKHFWVIQYGAPNSTPPSSWEPNNLSKHYNSAGHTPKDMTIQILELIHLDPSRESTTLYRGEREHHWMHQLCTLEPQGLNVLTEKKYKKKNTWSIQWRLRSLLHIPFSLQHSYFNSVVKKCQFK